MKVLVACEESQVVTKAFRSLGHEAYSNDIYECSGGHPEWHIVGDARDIVLGSWDIIIAHPPCTFLCKAQLWRCVPGTDRYIEQRKAIDFVKELYNAPCPQVAIENPIGCLSREWRRYDQLIYPYQFGDPYRKDICLWLKGLPRLDLGTESPIRKSVSNHVNSRMSQVQKSRIKSRFFPGVAKAMAEQWSLFME